MSQNEEIIARAKALTVARLQERTGVDIPCLGLFEPVYHTEFILEKDSGKVLMPPRISLSYQPAEYLLESIHYTTLDYQPPVAFFTPDFITSLAQLHDYSESAVATALEEGMRTLLGSLFKGRRVSFLDLGDFYVTEEVAGVLLLNFVPSKVLLATLNIPFSAYKPTKLRQDIELPDTQVVLSEPNDVALCQYAIHEAESTPVAPEEPQPTSENQLKLDAHYSLDLDLVPIASSPAEEPAPATEVVPKKKSKAWVWVLSIILFLIVGATTYWYTHQEQFGSILSPKEEEAPIAVVEESLPIVPDTIAQVATDTVPTKEVIPAPSLPIDTIALPSGSTLAKVAKTYYGNSLYWVYVYIANAEAIPNPDQLKPGQSLIIPPLEWYKLKDDQEEANKEAKAWATVILNKQFYSYDEQRSQLKIQP